MLLQDNFDIELSKKINKTMDNLNIPFYVLCSTRKKDGKIQETWRRRGNSCDKDYPNSRWISENEVDNWLKKNFNSSLKEVRNGQTQNKRPGQIKKTEQPSKVKQATRPGSIKPEIKPVKAPEQKKISGNYDLPEGIRYHYVALRILKSSKNDYMTQRDKQIVLQLINQKAKHVINRGKEFNIENDEFAKHAYYVVIKEDGRSYRYHVEGLLKKSTGRKTNLQKLNEEWEKNPPVNLRHDKAPESVKKFEPEIKPVERKKIIKKKSAGSKDLPGYSTIIETQAEKIKTEYYLMELNSLVPSHDYTTFAKNEDYPAKCQERNYHTDKNEQAKVNGNAKDLKAAFLINEDPTAVGGPPIVTSDKVVLGGNSRVMSMLRAVKSYPDKWAAYVKFLKQRLELFGFQKDDINSFKQPVLVRVIDIDIDRCSHYSWVLNKGLTQEISSSDRGITFAKDINEQALKKMGMVLEENEVETMSELINNGSVTKQLISIFREQGIITNTNYSQWVGQDGKFSQDGKLNVENILIGSILTRKNLIEDAKSYSDKIIQRIPYFLRLKGLPGEWNLIKYFEDAIVEVGKMRDAGYKLEWREKYLNQTNAFDDEIPEKTKLAWEILELPIRKFKIAIKKLTEIAEQQSDQSSKDAMFAVEKISPEFVMQDILKRVNDDQLSDAVYTGRQFDIGEFYKWENDVFLISGYLIINGIDNIELSGYVDGKKRIDFVPVSIFNQYYTDGKIVKVGADDFHPEIEEEQPEIPKTNIDAIREVIFNKAAKNGLGLGDGKKTLWQKYFI